MKRSTVTGIQMKNQSILVQLSMISRLYNNQFSTMLSKIYPYSFWLFIWNVRQMVMILSYLLVNIHLNPLLPNVPQRELFAKILILI